MESLNRNRRESSARGERFFGETAGAGNKSAMTLWKKLWLVILGVALAAGGPLLAQGLRWQLVKGEIQRKFPRVARIETAALADWLRDSRRAPPILLDVRTAAEFSVSHLANARRIEPDAAASAVTLPKDQPIVTYCSVGYRSAAFAERLRAAGFQKVANLDGSLFQWANENRPLVRDGSPTDKVHPFNRVWGALLDPAHRAENAPPALPQPHA